MNNNAQFRIIEDGAIIWDGTNVWNFTHIRKDAIIWNNCNIWNNVYIDTQVQIWNNVKIQNWVNIYNWVTLSDDVFVWPAVTFTNDLFPRAFIWSQEKVSTTKVEKWVSIGANATIKCWITIWEYSLIWAGTMVTKNVPPYSLVVWNPGRIVWIVDKNGNKL